MSDALYVDASAAIKLFLDEPGSALAADEIEAASSLISSRLLLTEVGSTLWERIEDPERRAAVEADWEGLWGDYQCVELSDRVARHATGLAQAHHLGTLDAIHLASVLNIPTVPLKFATWDRPLWDAARAVGLRTVPAERP
jgi:predicted nucleic acid-binding protein